MKGKTMNLINNNDALNILNGAGVDVAYEADALSVALEDEDDVRCFFDGMTLIVIDRCNGTEYVTVIPIEYGFDAMTVAETIKIECKNPSILLNIKRINDKCCSSFTSALGSEFISDHTIRDFARVEADYDPDPDVRMLTSADANVFCAVEDDGAKNRPSVAQLFDVFVNRGVGQILGLFKGDEIVGYLSFTKMGENAFNVDYIYVVHEARRMGIAKRLASAYVTYAEKERKIAYWSNAKNEASEKTAISVGMNVVREAIRYIIKH